MTVLNENAHTTGSARRGCVHVGRPLPGYGGARCGVVDQAPAACTPLPPGSSRRLPVRRRRSRPGDEVAGRVSDGARSGLGARRVLRCGLAWRRLRTHRVRGDTVEVAELGGCGLTKPARTAWDLARRLPFGGSGGRGGRAGSCNQFPANRSARSPGREPRRARLSEAGRGRAAGRSEIRVATGDQAATRARRAGLQAPGGAVPNRRRVWICACQDRLAYPAARLAIEYDVRATTPGNEASVTENGTPNSPRMAGTRCASAATPPTLPRRSNASARCSPCAARAGVFRVVPESGYVTLDR